MGFLFLDKGCTIDERTKDPGTGYYESFRISVLLNYQFWFATAPNNIPFGTSEQLLLSANEIDFAVRLSGRYAEITAFSSYTAIRRTIIKLTVIGHFCELKVVVLEEVSDQNSL